MLSVAKKQRAVMKMVAASSVALEARGARCNNDTARWRMRVSSFRRGGLWRQATSLVVAYAFALHVALFGFAAAQSAGLTDPGALEVAPARTSAGMTRAAIRRHRRFMSPARGILHVSSHAANGRSGRLDLVRAPDRRDRPLLRRRALPSRDADRRRSVRRRRAFAPHHRPVQHRR